MRTALSEKYSLYKKRSCEQDYIRPSHISGLLTRINENYSVPSKHTTEELSIKIDSLIVLYAMLEECLLRALLS